MSDDGSSACPFMNNDEGSANLCTGDIEYSAYGYNVRVWTAVSAYSQSGSFETHVY